MIIYQRSLNWSEHCGILPANATIFEVASRQYSYLQTPISEKQSNWSWYKMESSTQALLITKKHLIWSIATCWYKKPVKMRLNRNFRTTLQSVLRCICNKYLMKKRCPINWSLKLVLLKETNYHIYFSLFKADLCYKLKRYEIKIIVGSKQR